MIQLQSFTLITLLWAIPALGVNLASLVQRQEASSVSTRPEQVYTLFPFGEQDTSGSLSSTIPVVCDVGCYDVLSPYYFCFIGDTRPDGTKYDRSNCTNLCTQRFYDQTQQCLNCIIANGEERPTGYHTNTSLTVQPTSPADSSQGRVSYPNGLVNIIQANQILSNITEFCNGVETSLIGETTVTATPTTTGPYYTSWTKGETVSISGWPGLASYTSIPVATFTSRAASGNGPSQTQSNSAAPAASTSSQSSGASKRLRLLWFRL